MLSDEMVMFFSCLFTKDKDNAMPVIAKNHATTITNFL
jgi:hypothetical protein